MSYRSIRLVLREDDLSKDILADVFQGEMREVNQAFRNIYESMTEERREIICCIINISTNTYQQLHRKRLRKPSSRCMW